MQFSLLSLSLPLLLPTALSSHLPRSPPNTVIAIPPAVATGPSTVFYTSSDNLALDAPHVHPINNNSWDWYYFDAVSPTLDTSVIIILFSAPATGFFFGGPPEDILISTVFASVPGNDAFAFNFTSASEAVISLEGQGASGNWKDSGYSFVGKSDLSEYVVNVDSPQTGTKGKMKLTSVAPAHYPCGPAEAGEPLEVMPKVGWANAIPDAVAEVDMVIQGKKIKFTGVGYHDKNWSSTPFSQLLHSWYWIHARLGPYSFVFWDGLDGSNTERTSVYIACNGKILLAQCLGVKVRPTVDVNGKKASYPPLVGVEHAPKGFVVEIELPSGFEECSVWHGSDGKRGVEERDCSTGKGRNVQGQKKMRIEIENVGWIWQSDNYDRWTARVSGGVVGGQQYQGGVALLEQFAF